MTLAHQEFLKRIKKSFYLGPSNPNRMMSNPLAKIVSDKFNECHKNYSLKTLEIGSLSRHRQTTPASLILSIIYLDRLNKLDPNFVKLVSPSELFLVTLVSSMTFKVKFRVLRCRNFFFSWFLRNSTAVTMREWKFS